MITSLSESLGAPTASLAFAAVLAAKASSIELLHTATADVCFDGYLLALVDGICYIYNIRREAHLHLTGVSRPLLPMFLWSYLLSSLLPPFHQRMDGEEHLWHEMGKAFERLELHVEHFATLLSGNIFGDATMGR